MSIQTGLNIKDGMTIKDIYGNAHDLTPHHVRVMLGVGWACFLGSWLINIAYYKFHPSAVEVLSLYDKKKLYVFGRDVFSGNKERPSHGDVEGGNNTEGHLEEVFKKEADENEAQTESLDREVDAEDNSNSDEKSEAEKTITRTLEQMAEYKLKVEALEYENAKLKEELTKRVSLENK